MIRKFHSLILLMRVRHWVKNLFVFLPLFFNGGLGNSMVLGRTMAAFFSFCMAASSIYCLNDIQDRDADRHHAVKRNRPVASGAVTVREAAALLVFLLGGALAPILLLPRPLPVLAAIGAYYVLNVAYCLWLKQMAIVDVFVLALGYVLRLVGGSLAGGVPLTHWIVLMTYLLALFLALAKRRDDVLIMRQTGTAPRRNSGRYSLDFINQALTLTTAITIFCYIMYTVSPEVMARFGTRHLYATALFVLAGFMRYLQLSLVDGRTGDPTKLLFCDHVLQLVLFCWLIVFIAVIYLPGENS